MALIINLIDEFINYDINNTSTKLELFKKKTKITMILFVNAVIFEIPQIYDSCFSYAYREIYKSKYISFC